MENKLLFRKAGLVFRAINHGLRQQMLQMLEGKETTVTSLYVALRIEQSVCSQHLAILRNAGFVKTRRDGKKIYYSTNKERIDQLAATATVITEYRAPTFHVEPH